MSNPTPQFDAEAKAWIVDLEGFRMCFDHVADADQYAAGLNKALLAALEAERAKGRVWWCLRAPSGCEWMYPNDPGIPKESGWTCRKVRVVDEIPAPGEVGS